MAWHDSIAIIDADGTYPVDKLPELARNRRVAQESP
jgi:hypothetical protein